MKQFALIIILLYGTTCVSQEICTNGIDDDFDGKTDLMDEECACSGIPLRTKEMSIIPNHSFESKKCCPTGVSQMRCVNDWIQPSEGTSDFLHACGAYAINPSNDARIPDVPLPLPDGDGAVGIINGFSDALFYQGVYKEYVATRLWQPLKAGTAYELDMSVGFGLDASQLPPLTVTIWGHPEITGLPFNFGLPICPKQYDDQWIVLGTATVSGSHEWIQTTIPLNVAVDINCLAIGPDCSDPPDSLLYYYFDNLLLYRTEQRGRWYVDLAASPKCDKGVILGSSLQDDDVHLQWFKDNVAIPGATTDSLPLQNIALENGNYQLMASTSLGCALSEPYSFKAFNKLTTFADLGPDIVACPGQTVTLFNPPNTVEAYWGYGFWNTGQAAAQIQVTQTGDYWFDLTLHDIVTFDTVCHTRDTVHVSFETDAVDLGPDRLICDQQPIVLVNASVEGVHRWNTGETTSSITVTQPGVYADTVTLQAGCRVYGSVEVLPNPLQLDLGPDIQKCAGSPVHFVPEVPAGTHFLWNGMNSDPEYVATTSQQVTVAASYEGCIKRDTLQIDMLPAPVVNLGNDTTICEGQTLVLAVQQVDNEQYKWNDGSTMPTFQPTVSGTYALTVTGSNHCTASDTIAVDFSMKPRLTLPASLSLCRGGSLSFTPTAERGQRFLWSDGVNTDVRTFSQTGSYSLEVTNGCGAVTGNMLVKDAGICAVVLPNAFSPNHDGKNDVFISNVNSGLPVFILTVYNRWGQVVFRSADPGKGWDGRIAGLPAAAGSYVWTLAYRSSLNDEMKSEKGTVLLIR